MPTFYIFEDVTERDVLCTDTQPRPYLPFLRSQPMVYGQWSIYGLQMWLALYGIKKFANIMLL